ncbi:MAG: hypothetical protein HYZ42_11080 [Bacteroidetes bacterium]|nr:hypothetical protein [Bacteroidota bacterium]
MRKEYNYAVAFILIVVALIWILYAFVGPSVIQTVTDKKSDKQIKDSIYKEQMAKDSAAKENKRIGDSIFGK